MTELTFLGTGTSQGVPVIACRCEVCRSSDSRDKRLRTSALVRHGDTTLVIDAGPDFRQQMLREQVMRLDGILLTHEHKDHTAGIDDIRAFNHAMRRAMDIYATQQVQNVIRKDFDYAFHEHKYPGAPEINLVTIDGDTPFAVKDVRITPIKGRHYQLPVLGFRIGGIAYLTDFNSIEQSEIDKIVGVEVLVVNALRREKHLSHFTLSEALELRDKVRPQRTYLTHVSQEMGLYEEVMRELPENTYLAYDGLKISSVE